MNILKPLLLGSACVLLAGVSGCSAPKTHTVTYTLNANGPVTTVIWWEALGKDTVRQEDKPTLPWAKSFNTTDSSLSLNAIPGDNKTALKLEIRVDGQVAQEKTGAPGEDVILKHQIP